MALASIACKSDRTVSAKQNRTDKAALSKPVKTARVVKMPMERKVTVIGTLAAYDQATLSTKVPGRLETISVDLGSAVRKGQTIAQIDSQDYRLRLQQAEAALAQALARLGLPMEGTDDRVDPEQTSTVRQARAVLDEARLHRERSEKLFKQGLIAAAQSDAAESSYKVALSRYQDALEEVRNRQALLAQRRSELALARQQLDDTVIHVPFDGVVRERRVSPGEYLGSGAPIVTIVRMNPLRLRAEVPERDAHYVHARQLVRVTVEGNPNAYTGRITRLSPAITEQNRMLLVEADVINNGSLRPGSFVRAEIITDNNSVAIAVPTKAIVTFAGIEKVIVAQNGKAVEKPVTTGRRISEWTEVAGVNVGDAVIVEPGNLQSGQPIDVTE